MKKNFIVFLCCLWAFSANAQIFENDGCGVEEISDHKLSRLPWFGNNHLLYQILDNVEFTTTNYGLENALYRVPIKFWVYRNDDGSSGISDEEIKRFMVDLNASNINNNTGFVYYMYPEIGYINKTKHLSLGYYMEAPFQTWLHKQKGCINVFIPDEIIQRGINRHGTAVRGTYNSVTDGIAIRRLSHSSTLAHEIGHYFGLLHPHRNSTKGKCKQESVSRTRKFKACLFSHGLICEKSGDALCDTPAEPNMETESNDNCQYTGQKTDNWGDKYQPSTTNIMSYPKKMECRQTFTPSQIAVMLYSAKKRNIGAWTSSYHPESEYKNQYLFDQYEPDNSKGMASDFVFGQTQQHTFHKAFAGKKDLDQDVDWVRFQLKNTSQEVLIATSQGKYLDSDTELFLYDNANNLIATDDNGNGKTYSKISASKLKQGWYFLKIINKKKVNNPDICGYNLSIEVR